MDQCLKFAVCDDVLQERKIIVNMVQEYMNTYDYFAKIDEYDAGEQLLAEENPVYDLVFLDIYMKKNKWYTGCGRIKEKKSVNPDYF